MSAQSFEIFGDMPPASPVVLSVPHAGRTYPPALVANLRVPLTALRVLEDRHVDAVASAARGSVTMLTQRTARAWIDLNRSEQDRDPKVDDGAAAHRQAAPSLKVRNGLGLVPRRIAGAGDLWRRRFADVDIAARIASEFRPYHDALSRLMTAAKARYGVAVLLDLHSMPPLGAPGTTPRIVIGDQFGRSCANRFASRIESEAIAAGHAVARNTPYAGGEIVTRHGAPHDGMHAIQLELDRSLYLDAAMSEPGPGLDAIAMLIRRMIEALEQEALTTPLAFAAE